MYGDHHDARVTLIIVTAGSAASLLNSLGPVITLFIASLLIVILRLISPIHTYFVCDVKMLSNSQLMYKNKALFCKNKCSIKIVRVLLFLIGRLIIAQIFKDEVNSSQVILIQSY